MRIDDLDHLPETTTIDASSIGIVQVSAEPALQGLRTFQVNRHLRRGWGVGAHAGGVRISTSHFTVNSFSVIWVGLIPHSSLEHLLVSVKFLGLQFSEH